MRRVLALLAFAAALPLLAQSTTTCSPIIQGFSATKVTTALCSGTTPPAVNDTMLVGVGNSQFETKVTEVTSILGVTNVVASVVDANKAQQNLLLLSGSQSATLSYGSTSLSAKVQPANPVSALNYTYYKWAVGPAKAPNTNPATPTTSAENLDAISFTANAEYARGGIFGMTNRQSSLQSKFSVSIDSTDTDDAQFADNNRAALGVGFTNLAAGRVWMHGTAGLEAHADKAFHSGVNDLDAMVSMSGWVPVLRSFTVFSTQGQFIAAPLSFTAAYGYRSRHQNGNSTAGLTFEGTANYYFYMFDDYQVQLSGTWTVNDYDRAANIARTQRLFKAQISYLISNRNGFQAVASFQDGSAGTMLQDVRQYFVGVALAKLNLGGSGGSK